MTDELTIAITTPLEGEHVATIRAVDPRIRVLYEPAIMPVPRYHADHTGAPTFKRTPEQEQRFLAMLAEADVAFDFDRSHLRDLPALAPKLKWVQATSSGIGQTIRRAGLDQSTIIFTTASGVHARPLADFCLMSMLMFAKEYWLMSAGKAAKRWERYSGNELTGKTLALVGLGRVGREVASHGKKMDMRVVGMRRSLEPVENVDRVYARSELHEMLAEADVLVLIAPHTAGTEGMIGEAELAVMKPGALFINISRAQLVDEPALIRALREGRLAGAALDVVSSEPLPADSPLWELPNVIISPHSASTVTQENARITALFCDNLRHYLAGEPLLNVLDTKALY